MLLRRTRCLCRPVESRLAETLVFRMIGTLTITRIVPKSCSSANLGCTAEAGARRQGQTKYKWPETCHNVSKFS